MRNSDIKSLKYFFVSLTLVICVSLAAIFLAIESRVSSLINDEILINARAYFKSIVVTRAWNAHYGGVYVEKKEGMESTPYLENPEIKTIDGKIYTKKHPALMTQEISKIADVKGLFTFRITSLTPLNPNNKPDNFESRALLSFNQGHTEVFQKTVQNGKAYFRYMAPLYVEKACLQCHAKQGYKEGDLRGGISVTFNIDKIERDLKKNSYIIIFFGLILALMMVAATYMLYSRLLVKLSESRKKIEEIAITDELTSLYNRRHLLSRFDEEFTKASRLNSPLGCIMIDIDNFKYINDTFGHLTGDKILKGVSLIIRSSIRAYDIAGRFGGEEFLIILPETKSDGTKTVAEKILKTIKEATFLNDLRITISAGIANLTKDDDSLDSLIKRADDAMYKAKNTGKDRVCC